MLSRLRHIVSKDILVSIYTAFIQPHITYSIINWGGTYTSILEPLRKAMKHAVRLVSFEPMKSHAQPLFKKLTLSCLDDCYPLECAKFMHDSNNNILEKQVYDLFLLTKCKHTSKTRQATLGLFSQPALRTNSKKNSISNTSVKIWNDIPVEIRQSKTKCHFKKKYKSWLFCKYFDFGPHKLHLSILYYT